MEDAESPVIEENSVAAGAPPVPAPSLDSGAPPVPDERLAQLLNLASEHDRAGRLEAAAQTLAGILAETPEQPAALHMLGIVTFRRGDQIEAARLMERAIARAPANALFHRNICEVYRIIGRYDDAAVAGKKAVALAPGEPHCHNNLGVTHYHRLEIADAVQCAERAMALAPDFAGAHFGLAEALLISGDFARGWQEYEWRFKLANSPRLMPPSDRPQWDGTPLGSERLLLIADQGYGDAIQFCRYIPWAAERAANIALACAREVQPVVAQQRGVAIAFDHWDKKPDFAAYCPLSGLPRLAQTRLDTIPAAVPYIHADPQKTIRWADRLAGLLPKGYRRIGIAWAGRPTHTNDRNRSTRLETLSPLAELPRTALVSLQKGPAQAQIGDYWGRAPLVAIGPELRDYGDTMAVIDCLDLVITVDTSIGHLTGAMGKPVWIMLPFAPDWRWLLNRMDSPWYPTARLFRQRKPRDWGPIVAAIKEELESG
ncbi:MAG TPA: tetratricopeptide repeat protein [Stellaceae bacterium]|nr:tetratricopeptide repeat protein [Stellaceae bacterium]